MNKKDIERMISLADDRYVDEIFQDRLTGRRKNIFVTFTAVAAALAVVAVGISYFVSNAGNADKITVAEPMVSEVGTVDYSMYFQNHDEFAVKADDWDSWSVESAGIFCYFSDSEYVKSVMPFDMSSYTNANCNFFYDYKDEVKSVMIHANNSDDNTSESAKRLYVEVYKSGEFFPHLALDRCKSMKRFDVDVYGFDLLDTEENDAGVVFAMADKEYLIGGNNLSYDEIGVIMDSVITNGLWADRFDISKAEMEYFDNINAEISLAEANEISPFAGHVPQMQSFGDMQLNNGAVSYYAGRDENNGIVPKWLYFTYFNGTDKDICLQYFTEAAADEVQHIEKTVKIGDIELDKLSEYGDGGNYAFAIDYGDFKINIWANNCTDSEILELITAVRIGASGAAGASSSEITLADARKIAPYGEYVPQTDSIGSMRVTSVYYDESIYNGAVQDTAVIVNLMDDNDKNMIIHYGNFKEKVRDKYVPLAEVYDRFESFSEPSEYNEDCRLYKFTIDCGDFWIKINADCLPEEMKQCIDEINFRKNEAVTLAEANKIAPYEGYVPQNETVGDMKLGSVQYNGSNIVLDYSYNGENRFSYIGLTYTEDKSMTADYSVITLEELINSDIVFHWDDSEDGRQNYKLAVKCNGLYGSFYVCVDGEKCTTAELYDCILTLLMEKGNIGSGEKFDFSPFGSLEEADRLAPFAGYVPNVKTIGDMNIYLRDGCEVSRAESAEYGQVLNMAYQSVVTSGSTYGGNDFKVISLMYTEKKAYNIPESPVVPFRKIDGINLDELKTDGIRGGGRVCYRFVIDCGTCYITVAADCLPEEMKDYLMSIALEKEFGQKLLTIDKVKELAEKGEELTWSDFEEFSGNDVGSGLYIMVYPVEGTDYSVAIGGGSLDEKPMYINFGKGDGNYIDLRHDSLDDYLNEKPFLNFEF